jgi:tetratricopeptide (TPR) repeat protein
MASLLVISGLSACSTDPEVAKRRYFENGNKYFAQEKYKEAIVEYRNAVQQDPKFGEARLKLADAYVKEGDARNAYREYIRAADLLPQNLEAQTKAATFLLLARQFEDAKSRAEKALAVDPRHIEAQVLRANALAGLKDLDGAVKDIEEAIRLDPKQATTYSNLGALQLAKGNREEAEAAYQKAVDTDPKSLTARLALANFYWATARREEAEKELRAALELDPKNDLANRAMATFYIGSGRASEAEPFLRTLAAEAKEVAPRLALADYYIVLGRDKDAEQVLVDAAKQPAAWAAARARMAAIHYARGQQAEGHKAIDDVLAKEPKNLQALLVKSRFLVSERKLDEALPRAKQATAADPSNAEAHYLTGLILAEKNDIDGAIAEMSEVVRLNPRATPAQVQLARLELMRGGAATSVQHAEQAVTSAPGDPIARLTLARSLMARGDVARAEAEMKALREKYPNAAAVHSQYGLLDLVRRDLASAKKSFDRALELDPNDFDAFRGLIGVDLANKRYDEARAKVEGRVAMEPKNPAVLLLAARTYASMGDMAKTEEHLRKTLEVNPSRLEAYGMLGQLYLQQRKLDRAVAEFHALAERQPKNVGAPTMIAMILQIQGRTAEAQKKYEDVMQIDPRAPVAANNLAWIYADGGGNLDVALHLAQVAKEQLPDSPEVNDTLGFDYLKKDLASLAVPPLQVAVEKDPKNPSYRYRLGQAYAKLGNKDAAKRELQEALKLRPDFPEAADARRILSELGTT